MIPITVFYFGGSYCGKDSLRLAQIMWRCQKDLKIQAISNFSSVVNDLTGTQKMKCSIQSKSKKRTHLTSKRFECMDYFCKVVVLKVWSLDPQYQHQLGICQQCKILGAKTHCIRNSDCETSISILTGPPGKERRLFLDFHHLYHLG